MSVSGLQAAPVTAPVDQAAQGPLAGDGGISAPHVVNTAAATPQAAAPSKVSALSPILSPDNAAREAAQNRAGPAGPSVNRAQALAANATANGPSANPPAVNFSFNGLQECQGDAAFCWNPPDQGAAGGPNHYLEMKNESWGAYDRNGNLVVGPISNQAWWGYASTASLFDPVATFGGGHFYMVSLFFDSNSGASTINLSVSNTNQASGGWCNYFFAGNLGATWADFPKLGITHDSVTPSNGRILISTNQFNFNNSFNTNSLYEIRKDQLDACVGANFFRWNTFTNNDGSVAFTIVPAVNYDNTAGSGWWVGMVNFGTNNVVTAWHETCDIIGNNCFQRWGVTTAGYSIPPNARQPGTATRIDTIDNRLQSFNIRYQKAWAMHATAVGGCGAGNDTSGLHLFELFTPTSATAASLVTITDPGGAGAGTHDAYIIGACSTDQYNGAVSHDANGNALFIYNESGTTEYENPRMGGWHLETGLAYGSFVGAVNTSIQNQLGRNGDYSAAAIDSVDQRFVLGCTEILLTSTFWGTRCARLINSANPI